MKRQLLAYRAPQESPVSPSSQGIAGQCLNALVLSTPGLQSQGTALLLEDGHAPLQLTSLKSEDSDGWGPTVILILNRLGSLTQQSFQNFSALFLFNEKALPSPFPLWQNHQGLLDYAGKMSSNTTEERCLRAFMLSTSNWRNVTQEKEGKQISFKI